MKYTFREIQGTTGFDGCPGHDEPADPTDDHFSINCGLCEPHLGSGMWFDTPGDVPMTHAERQAKARALEELAGQQTAAMALLNEVMQGKRSRL